MLGLRRHKFRSAQHVVGPGRHAKVVRVSAAVFAVAHAAQGPVRLTEMPTQGAASALKAMVHGVHWRREALLRLKERVSKTPWCSAAPSRY